MWEHRVSLAGQFFAARKRTPNKIPEAPPIEFIIAEPIASNS